MVEAVEVGEGGGLVDADAPEEEADVGDVCAVGEEVLGYYYLALRDDAAVGWGGGVGVYVNVSCEVAVMRVSSIVSVSAHWIRRTYPPCV